MKMDLTRFPNDRSPFAIGFFFGLFRQFPAKAFASAALLSEGSVGEEKLLYFSEQLGIQTSESKLLLNSRWSFLRSAYLWRKSLFCIDSLEKEASMASSDMAALL